MLVELFEVECNLWALHRRKLCITGLTDIVDRKETAPDQTRFLRAHSHPQIDTTIFPYLELKIENIAVKETTE
jgi:hypothetical protein